MSKPDDLMRGLELGKLFAAGRAEDEIAQLKAENAELREEYDMYRDLVRCMVHPDIPDQLEAENTKLRELVKYAYECAIHSDHATCDDCERINGCCILVGRMRELGIEVDG